MIPTWPDKVWYPWAKIEVGGGFFIPTLTPDLLCDPVLDSAVRLGMRAEAYEGIYNGQYGLAIIRTG